MSQLVQLEGKNTEQRAHCAMWRTRQAEVLYRFDLYTWNDILDLSL